MLKNDQILVETGKKNTFLFFLRLSCPLKGSCRDRSCVRLHNHVSIRRLRSVVSSHAREEEREAILEKETLNFLIG